jgi:hypothetical protein
MIGAPVVRSSTCPQLHETLWEESIDPGMLISYN